MGLTLISDDLPDALCWRGTKLVDLVHTGGRGYVSLSGPGEKGDWRDFLVPARHAVAAAASVEGEVDRYISVAQFRGGHRRIADRVMSFGASAVELDQHNGPPCEPERLWAEVRAYLNRIGIALPSVVVASGRGLHLWWPYQLRIPGRAAPRWRALQSALVDRLKRFGADPTCVDAARVLRLPGTINRKTGTEARIIFCSEDRADFESLFASAVPFGRLELKNRREAAQTSRKRRAASGATPRSQAKRPWPAAAVADLRRLAGHRKGFRRDLERNNATFIAATMLAQSLAGDAYISAAMAFGRETTDLPESEIRAAARSAMKKRQEDGRGYLYSKARIIKLLGVTIDESMAAGLSVLIPGRKAGDARAMNAERQRAYRERRGARPRSQSFEQTKPWQAEGVSRATWYARRAQAAAVRPVRQTVRRPVRLIRNATTWRSPMQGRARVGEVGGEVRQAIGSPVFQAFTRWRRVRGPPGT